MQCLVFGANGPVQFWRRSDGWKFRSAVQRQSPPSGGVGLKKHCKLYALEKYFVYHIWRQNNETVTLPVKLSRQICIDLIIIIIIIIKNVKIRVTLS